jgi:hypothetical protein
VSPAGSFEKVAEQQTVGTTHIALRWLKPPDPEILRFEIWAKNVAFDSQEPFLVQSNVDSPASITLNADSDTPVVLYLRTIMKNGLSSDLNSSPTVSTAITLEDPTIQITDPSQIDPGVVQDQHFDRVSANQIAIVDADIVNLTATKITAGTLIAGVILSSNILATQISAGTMSAVNVSAGTYSLISGNEQMLINGTVGFNQLNTSNNQFTKILGGLLTFGVSSTNYGDFGVDSEGGVLTLRNTSGANKVILALTPDISNFESGGGIVECVNASGTLRAALGVDDSSGHGRMELVGSSSQIVINGTKVVGTQGSTISDPAGGGTVDAEARTAINALIDRLQAHGLIA